MTKTVVALYDDSTAARQAMSELVSNGFPHDDISLMTPDATGDYGRELGGRELGGSDMETSNTAQGAGVGAGLGAALGGFGGLLVGLGVLTIPGIGPVLAAGPLAAAFSGLAGAGVGAVAGGVTGGLLGALMDMGVPEERAHYYAEGVRRGGTLVIVRSPDDRTRDAVNIVNRHRPIDLNERATQWRESGWTRFNPDEPAQYTGDRPMGSYGSESAYTGETTYRDQAPKLQPSPVGFTQSGDDFSRFDPTFRTHFDTSPYAQTYTYDDFQPAYRYGYEIAHDERYRNRDWDEIESDVRSSWDTQEPGTWERFKDSIRHAWQEMKDQFE